MRWSKKGLIYKPNGSLWWAKTHGYIPTPDVHDRFIRVYFSGRDESGIGRIGYVDLDISSPKKILYLTPEPVLDVGEFGSFDESGVNACCIVTRGDEKWMYYFGWQKNVTGSYLLFCGLAISNDEGKTFQRYSRVPILDRIDREPFVRSAVSVIEDNGAYRMWYVSGTMWTEFRGKPCPSYVIRYAESRDGINWRSTDKICIDSENVDEFGFGRPWVVKELGLYKMWYSIRSRSKAYRIGYAESKDGIAWERMDSKVGIDVSLDGWDSEMLCFPSIINLDNTKWMFYNGNHHGAEGFGYAEFEET